MGRRRLSADEIASLGLERTAAPAGGRRRLSPDEVSQLGLDAPSAPDEVETAALAAGQGITGDFFDELGGGIAKAVVPEASKLGKAFEPSPDDTPEQRRIKEQARADREAAPTNYEVVRDSIRRGDEAAREAHPEIYYPTKIGSAVVSTLAVPAGNGVAGAIKAGGALGAISGLGASEADLARKGEYGKAALDTAIGGAEGAAGGALGYGAVKAGSKAVAGVREALASRAAQRLAEADERAAAMAAEKVAARNNSLRGVAGGEAQKASRLTENIRRIEGWDRVPDDPGALDRAAQAAADKANKLEQQMRAANIGPDAIDAKGALASAGSKADAARKAKEMVDAYRQAADELGARAKAIRGGGQLPPDNLVDVKGLRQQAMRSPEFMAQENQVLLHALEDLPDQRAKAEAARAAYRQALETTPEDVQKGASDLLSGRAAWEAVKARLLRYGPPMAASAAGAAFGGPIGAVVGGAAGYAAGHGLEALAGAGMRPALRSWINLVTKYPAVQRAVWGGVQRLVSQSPEQLGRFGRMLHAASKDGAMSVRLLHEALLQDSPAYAHLIASLTADDVDQAMGGGAVASR